MGRYRVVIGDEFEVDAVDVTDAEVVVEAANAAERLEDAKLRRLLAPGILAACALALLVAAAIGIFDGTFNEIGAVWDAVALPLGAILATYFAKGSL
jgi:hypothetical protein